MLKHNYQLALYYLHKGIYDGITQIDPTHLSYCYDGLATFYLQHKVVDSALYYSKRELAALKNTAQYDLSAGYNNLYQSYRLKGLKDSTLKYEDLAIAAKDSVNSANQQNLSDFQNQLFKEQLRLRDLEKERISAEDRNKTIAFVSGIAIILFLAFVFYRNAKRTKAANKLLSQQKEEIEDALSQLKSTQTQLVQREKMASLGELTAGIAHEIQNPLNFVNNFSDVNREMLEELKEELEAGNTDEVTAIVGDILRNEEKINHHGKRAEAIVKGMLQHSRTSSGDKQPTDINVLAEEFLKLSYQGLRAKDKSFNAEIVTKLDKNIAKAKIVQQDVGRVLLNIFNNAFYAVNQKQKTADKDYKPTVTLTTSAGKGNVIIKIEDNGTGIPEAIKEKIMQPFFTTKPTGEGTGLGLSISYDIVVKAHGGEIKVESTEGKGSEFTIIL